MKINWTKALIAGISGTVLFDLVGLVVTGTLWDIPGVLSNAIGLPFIGALGMHYINGIALAAIYAALSPSLFGPRWLRALTFITLETVMLVWFLMFPLLGMGIAGIEAGLLFPILSMTRHWAFAIPLFILTKEADEETEADDCGQRVQPLIGHARGARLSDPFQSYLCSDD